MYHTRQHVLLTYFALVSLPVARAVFLVRPFLKGPIRIESPKHNFWPYVPVSVPERGENETSYFQKPDHNFWPYIPVKSPHLQPNSSYFDVPRHNFWPFIPVVPPGRNGTKPIPVTPPVPLPTVPRPETGKFAFMLCVDLRTVRFLSHIASMGQRMVQIPCGFAHLV